MKATGMIRHIDELGRIVIPKEMRRIDELVESFKVKELRK